MNTSHYKQILHDSKAITQLICHRKPERTFQIRGRYFPVCSRCTGIYLTAFVYFIYVYFFYVHYTPILIFAAILMSIPTSADGITQFIGLRQSNNTIRFSTGLMAGLGLGIIIKALKFYILV